MHKPNSLLTSQDAARLAGVSAATVRTWEKTGKLPAVRTAGGIRLFTREDVNRVIAQRTERASCAG